MGLLRKHSTIPQFFLVIEDSYSSRLPLRLSEKFKINCDYIYQYEETPYNFQNVHQIVFKAQDSLSDIFHE